MVDAAAGAIIEGMTNDPQWPLLNNSQPTDRYQAPSASAPNAPVSEVERDRAERLLHQAHREGRITTTDSQAVAIVYSTGPNRQPDGLNASYSAAAPSYQAGESTADFDDLIGWLGRPLLIARVAQAGRL